MVNVDLAEHFLGAREEGKDLPRSQGCKSCVRGRVQPCVPALGCEAPQWAEEDGSGVTSLAGGPTALSLTREPLLEKRERNVQPSYEGH